MANTQAQFGFQQFGYLPGAAPDYQQSKGLIAKGYSTNIYFGDPVCKSSASVYMQVASNATSTTVWGVFVGCTYAPTGGGAPVWSPWWPGGANADATGYVIDSPNALFKVAAILTTVPATAVGSNIGHTTGAGGTTIGGGFSTYCVDQSTLTTNSVYPWQVYAMYPGVGNGSDTTTNYNWVIVSFNAQRFRAGASGVT